MTAEAAPAAAPGADGREPPRGLHSGHIGPSRRAYLDAPGQVA